MPLIRIATRSSPLALWQAEHVKSLLEATSPDLNVEILHVTTTGDRNRQDALRQFGGAGVFTREVQNAVLRGDADIAVHSLKDLPTQSAEGLVLGGIPSRASRHDALLLPEGRKLESLHDIEPEARVGTGSPRRQAQLLFRRGDLQMQEIRGNVETRIRKLDEREFDAIVLAEAGLRRLGLDDRISLVVQPPEVYPAVGQGALGIECREDDRFAQQVLAEISDDEVTACATAERALLSHLRAGCHAPLGALSACDYDQLKLTGVLLSSDGTERLEASAIGSIENAHTIGVEVAEELLKQGGNRLVESSQ